MIYNFLVWLFGIELVATNGFSLLLIMLGLGSVGIYLVTIGAVLFKKFKVNF